MTKAHLLAMAIIIKPFRLGRAEGTWTGITCMSGTYNFIAINGALVYAVVSTLPEDRLFALMANPEQ